MDINLLPLGHNIHRIRALDGLPIIGGKAKGKSGRCLGQQLQCHFIVNYHAQNLI